MKEFGKPDSRNESFGITPDVLDDYLGKVPLSDKIPGKIRAMLDYAKKIYKYSYYEYEFYSLGMIYIFLLSETAAKERFLYELPKEIKLKKKNQTIIVNNNYNTVYKHLSEKWRIVNYEEITFSLKSILNWLKKHGILPNRIDNNKIEKQVELRNLSAHLQSHYINMPTIAIPVFWIIVDFVNCLYDPTVHKEEPLILKQQRNEYQKNTRMFKKIIDLVKQKN
jgi:hypothetical protein